MRGIASSRRVRVACWNINGLRDAEKRRLVANVLRDFDLVLLQEVHNISEQQVADLEARAGGTLHWRQGSQNTCKVAFLVQGRVAEAVRNVRFDGKGRVDQLVSKWS